VNDFEYPASHWFTYVSGSGQGGMPYHGLSPLGNVQNANALAEVVAQNGGDVWTNTPVERILIKDGLFTGLVVRRDDREVEVSAKLLVSDLGPRKTVDLAGRENFDPDYLKQVDALRPAPIVANVIASDKLLVDVPGGLLIVGAKRIVAGMPVTKTCPSLPRRASTCWWSGARPLPACTMSTSKKRHG